MTLRKDLKPGDMFSYYDEDGIPPTPLSTKYHVPGGNPDRPHLGTQVSNWPILGRPVKLLARNAGGVLEFANPVHVPKSDTINSPAHYARLSPQPIEVMAAWNLPCFPSMAIKYLARAGFKDGVDAITDYRKGISYLEREIARLQGKSVVKDVPTT